MGTATAADAALSRITPFVILLVYGLVLIRRRKPAAEPEPAEQSAVGLIERLLEYARVKRGVMAVIADGLRPTERLRT